MKNAELLQIGSELLKQMSERGIRLDDYQYLSLYEEYQQRRKDNEKYWYIIYDLAEKYHISQSSVIHIIRRLGKE